MKKLLLLFILISLAACTPKEYRGVLGIKWKTNKEDVKKELSGKQNTQYLGETDKKLVFRIDKYFDISVDSLIFVFDKQDRFVSSIFIFKVPDNKNSYQYFDKLMRKMENLPGNNGVFYAKTFYEYDDNKNVTKYGFKSDYYGTKFLWKPGYTWHSILTLEKNYNLKLVYTIKDEIKQS